jgi:tRNA dimethylallyltransferase
MHLAGNPPLLVILGPTAVGKTRLALEMAAHWPIEVVSADSRQVYRGMDIGTAKPTAAERAAVPHHCLDLVNPDETVSLAQMKQAMTRAIDDIHRRGKLPLLVGGTGQYISAVIEGWSIPEVPPNAALRAELEAFAAEHGAQALHDRLRALDATAADNIAYQNVRRVVRALEVCLETGRPMTELQHRHPPSYDVVVWGLTMEREALYAQADRRVEGMIAAGFVEEVRGLLALGYRRDLPSMSGLGYRELAAHLQDGLPLDEAVRLTQHATHDFIRRQYTWFRKMGERILWHNVRSLEWQEVVGALPWQR